MSSRAASTAPRVPSNAPSGGSRVSATSHVNTPTLPVNSPAASCAGERVSAASHIGTPNLSVDSPATSRAGERVSAASCVGTPPLSVDLPAAPGAGERVSIPSCVDGEDAEDPIEDTEDPIVEDAQDPIVEDTQDLIVEDAEDPIVEDAEDPGSAHEDLQGASHTTGGIFRGRAMGNVYNIGDTWEAADTAVASGPVMGRVLLYNSHDIDAKPVISIMHAVTPILKPVLRKLADRYSPIRSEFVLLFV
jgi:hypothetical protein